MKKNNKKNSSYSSVFRLLLRLECLRLSGFLFLSVSNLPDSTLLVGDVKSLSNGSDARVVDLVDEKVFK